MSDAGDDHLTPLRQNFEIGNIEEGILNLWLYAAKYRTMEDLIALLEFTVYNNRMAEGEETSGVDKNAASELDKVDDDKEIKGLTSNLQNTNVRPALARNPPRRDEIQIEVFDSPLHRSTEI
jgi:hypothetical protein